MRVRENILNVSAIISASIAYFLNPYTVPAGYYKDTASILLNATCLRLTQHDEYGAPWPTIIRSFGDFKPPLFTYLATLESLALHPSLFALRLLSMLVGFASVLGLIVFMRRPGVLPNGAFRRFAAPFFAACLLSSWVMVVQRFPVEPSIDIALALAQVVCAYGLLRDKSWWWAVLHGASVGLGVYTYHSLKAMFFVQYPGLLFCAYLCCDSEKRSRIGRRLAIAMPVAALVAGPFIFDMFGAQQSLARYHQVSEIHPFAVLTNFWQHINGLFLFWSGDANLRHHHGFWGELNIVFLPLSMAGVSALWRDLRRKPDAFWLYIVGLFFVSFIPASVTFESVPHALRTHLAIIPTMLLCAYGVCGIAAWLEAHRVTARHRAVVATLLVATAAAHAIAGVYHYQVRYPRMLAHEFEAPPVVARTLPTPPAPPNDHSPDTVFERLFRVTALGDMAYCNNATTPTHTAGLAPDKAAY